MAAKSAKVIDTTAAAGEPKRIHEIIVDGRRTPYSFGHLEKVEMPWGHAVKFLSIPSFEVYDLEGTRMRPTLGLNQGVANATLQLEHDECVAKLDELTIEALVARAGPLAGGEDITRNTGKEAVIAFLIGHRKKAVAATKPKPPARAIADAEIDELGDDDPALDELVPKSEVEKMGNEAVT